MWVSESTAYKHNTYDKSVLQSETCLSQFHGIIMQLVLLLCRNLEELRLHKHSGDYDGNYICHCLFI